jgi:hypothetical protein
MRYTYFYVEPSDKPPFKKRIRADMAARNARLADMTDDEKADLAKMIEKDTTENYDFLGV